MLDLGDERLEVATACNGLAMLMSLSATVVTACCWCRCPRGRRSALLVSLVPIALACNVIRIAATAYCYEGFGRETADKSPTTGPAS